MNWYRSAKSSAQLTQRWPAVRQSRRPQSLGRPLRCRNWRVQHCKAAQVSLIMIIICRIMGKLSASLKNDQQMQNDDRWRHFEQTQGGHHLNREGQRASSRSEMKMPTFSSGQDDKLTVYEFERELAYYKLRAKYSVGEGLRELKMTVQPPCSKSDNMGFAPRKS